MARKDVIEEKRPGERMGSSRAHHRQAGEFCSPWSTAKAYQRRKGSSPKNQKKGGGGGGAKKGGRGIHAGKTKAKGKSHACSQDTYVPRDEKKKDTDTKSAMSEKRRAQLQPETNSEQNKRTCKSKESRCWVRSSRLRLKEQGNHQKRG